jgi:hypothetical protein
MILNSTPLNRAPSCAAFVGSKREQHSTEPRALASGIAVAQRAKLDIQKKPKRFSCNYNLVAISNGNAAC